MSSNVSCPLCGSEQTFFVLSAMDHTVSNESFSILECRQCSGRFTQNVPTASEIGKYYQSELYISHTNSSQGLFNKLYQLVRNYSLVSKRKLVCAHTKKTGGDLLDYGCGTGSFLYEMKANGWNVHGIEPDPGAAEKASKLTGISVDGPDKLGHHSPKSFDVITLWHVLEHVHELNDTLTNFKNTIKKDGLLFIAVPNYQSFDASYYHQYWAAYDVPRHLYHFSKKSMEILIKKNGFRIESVLPMWFDSFYVSLLSEKYKKNPLGPLFAFVIGSLSNLAAFFNGKSSSLIYVIKSV